jgi:hypothetical protein
MKRLTLRMFFFLMFSLLFNSSVLRFVEADGSLVSHLSIDGKLSAR